MWILVVSLVVLTIVAMLIGKGYYYRINKKIENGELEEIPPVVEVEEECCGQHETCEKDSLLAAVSKELEYYNDEELDRFKGTKQEDYTEADIEEFRHVLYTMKTDEVDTWAHCLQTRGIEIPQEIKDEILLMLQ